MEVKPAIEQHSYATIRFSNLSIAMKFSDQDKDKFLDEAFDYIANYIEESLKELKNRNKEIDYAFKRLDSQSFYAVVYIDQQTKAQSMVICGSFGRNSKSISYSHSISPDRNSLRACLNFYLRKYWYFFYAYKFCF